MMPPFTFNSGHARELPRNLDWLSAAERESLERFSDRSARDSWSIGRFLAKQLVLAQLHFPGDLAAVEICSRDGLGRAIRPQLFVLGCRVQRSLSISHRDGIACAALSSDPGLEVGVDLTPEFVPGLGLLRSSFTVSEQNGLDDPSQSKALHAAEIWATKEAAFKAANDGGPFVPSAIEVFTREAGARSFCVSHRRHKTVGRATLFKLGPHIAAVACCRAASARGDL